MGIGGSSRAEMDVNGKPTLPCTADGCSAFHYGAAWNERKQEMALFFWSFDGQKFTSAETDQHLFLIPRKEKELPGINQTAHLVVLL
jgi:hypothetical protein